MSGQNKIVISIAAIGALASVQAQDGIVLGDMVLTPYVTGEFTYDDNVLNSADKDSDYYMQGTVGAKLSRESDALSLDSSIWYSRRSYDEYSDKDANRWGVAGMGKIKTDKSFLSGMVDFRQVDDYDDAPAFGLIPSGFEGTVDQAFDRTESERRRLYDASIGGGQQLTDDLQLQAAYKFYAVDYDTDALEDWNENVLGAELAFSMTDKTAAYVDAQYGLQNGDGAPDGATFTTARVGVKNSITEKSTIRVGAGVTHYSTDDDEYTEASYEAVANWLATDSLIMFVSGRNEIQPTGTDDELQLSNRASAGVRLQVTRQLDLVASGSLIYDKELDGDEDESQRKIGTLRADYAAANGLSLFAKVELTDAEEDASDDYDRFRGTLGAGYKF